MRRWLLPLLMGMLLLAPPGRALASVHGADPVRRPRPGVYVEDQAGQPPFSAPWAQGQAFRLGWRQLEPVEGQYDFAILDRWLSNVARAGQRGVAGVLLRCAGPTVDGDGCAPSWALDWDPVVVGDQPRLNYLAPHVQERLASLVDALAKRYAADPRLSHIEIDPGYGGEAAPCPHDNVTECAAYRTAYAAQPGAWAAYLEWLLQSYETSFQAAGGGGHVPLQVSLAGATLDDVERATLAKAALQLGMGYQDSELTASYLTGQKRDGRCAQDWQPGDPGYREEYAFASPWAIISQRRPEMPVSLAFDRYAPKSEPALTDEENAWWSVFNALDKHASVLYIGSDSARWEDAWRYFARYAGRDQRTTPDVWIALRDGPATGCGDAGDYQWFLYHQPEAAGDSQQAYRASSPGGRIGTTWQGAFARGTDVSGNHPALYFDVDNAFLYGGEHIVQVEVTYWDGSPEMAGIGWQLAYDATTSPNQRAETVTLSGSERWLVHTFILLDVTFRNRLSDVAGQPGSDLSLVATGDGDVRFHMLRVRDLGGLGTAEPALTRAALPFSAVTPAPSPDPAETIVAPGPSSGPEPASTPLPPALQATPAAPPAFEATPALFGNDALYYEPLRGPGRVRDTYLDARLVGEDFERANSLVLRGDGSTAAMLAFDISDIPVTATVAAAWLELTVTGRARPLGMTGAVYGATQPWSEPGGSTAVLSITSAISVSAPGLLSVLAPGQMPEATFALPATGLFQVPVTGLVQEWVAEPAANHGMIVQGQGEPDAEYYLASSEWRTVDARPRLRVRLADAGALPLPAATPELLVEPAATSILMAATPAREPEIEARIVAVSPAVSDAATITVTAYLSSTVGQEIACDWQPVIRLWGAAGQQPARPLATGVPRLAERAGQRSLAWEFPAVDRVAAQGQESLLHLFVMVEGVRTRHNIVTLGTGQGTDYPEPRLPEETAPDDTSSLDASVEIVWPHGSATITEAVSANVSAALFRQNTRQILPPTDGAPELRLHWSLDDGPDQSGPQDPVGQPRLIQTPWLSYYLWDFNDVSIAAARDEGHYVNFWLEVDAAGVEYTSNVWSHGYGLRAFLATPGPEPQCH